MKATQPWHYLENPFESLENLERPDSWGLDSRFRKEPRNLGNKKAGQTYEEWVEGKETSSNRACEQGGPNGTEASMRSTVAN